MEGSFRPGPADRPPLAEAKLAAPLLRSGRARWLGWPGPTEWLDRPARRRLDRALAAHGLEPLHLAREEVERYYDGFANAVLWPILHCFPSLGR